MGQEKIEQNQPSKSELLHQQSRRSIAKLKINSNPDQVLDDPKANGFKSFDELQGVQPYKIEVKSGMNLTNILKEYFENNVGIKDKNTVDKEVALSLYHLTQQRDVSGAYINVNSIHSGWNIEISDGRLFVSKKTGQKIIYGAYLRKPEKTPAKLAELKKDVEKLKELPAHIYKYKRSKYIPIDNGNIDSAIATIANQQKEADPDKPFKIAIRSTADSVRFKLDRRSKKRRVDLKRGAVWQNDYVRALSALKNSGTLPQLAGLDFARRGIFAVHELKLADQQIVMNHALAYLRGEKLREDLKAKVSGKNIEFDIKTEWLSNPDTRIAGVVDLEYSEKPKPIPRPPEPPKPKPVPRPPEPPTPKPPEPIEPTPKPPEIPPIEPGEIPKLIEALENDKFKISKKAILKGGLISKTQGMVASTVTRKDGRIIDTWFVIDKKNPENPKYYIAIDRSDRFRVLIGEMKYDSGMFSLEAKPGKILKAIDLDKTNRQATIRSMSKILEAIK